MKKTTKTLTFFAQFGLVISHSNAMDLSLFFDLFEAYFQDAPNAYVPIVLRSQKFFKEPAVECLVLTVTHLDKQAWEPSSY